MAETASIIWNGFCIWYARVPTFYYIDLFFDASRPREAIDAMLGAVVASGGRFKSARVKEPAIEGIEPFFAGAPGDAGAVSLELREIGERGAAYISDRLSRGMRTVQFPPWGRVLFEFPFEFDESLLEDLRTEEGDCHASARDMGVGFAFEQEPVGDAARLRASVSFWEDFVLQLGNEETHELNMARVLGMLERIYDGARPYFGAMDEELHLHAERAHAEVLRGEVPAGGGFVLIGRNLLGKLDADRLTSSGFAWRVLSDGGILLQTRNRT